MEIVRLGLVHEGDHMGDFLCGILQVDRRLGEHGGTGDIHDPPLGQSFLLVVPAKRDGGIVQCP